MTQTMRPLSDWPLVARRGIRGVLTDIDDTLTTEGAITEDALAALHALADAGLPVIAVTGRPLGWSVPFAVGDAAQGIVAWPIEAIVAENGSVAVLNGKFRPLFPSINNSLLLKIYHQDAQTRQHNFTRMQQVAARVLREVPGTVLSQDSPGRETDIAIDHSEFCRLSAAKIAKTVGIMRQEGMNATVSSIHINAWFGDHNKWVGAKWMVQQLYGRSLAGELAQWVYVGDSTNDQLMFSHFANSVGVANIRRFEAELASLPTYIAPSERGAGFAQVVAAILQARSA